MIKNRVTGYFSAINLRRSSKEQKKKKKKPLNDISIQRNQFAI